MTLAESSKYSFTTLIGKSPGYPGAWSLSQSQISFRYILGFELVYDRLISKPVVQPINRPISI